MSQIIVFPRGQLSELDKARMEEAGIIAVEADDPSKVVQLVPCSTLINADDFLMSALAGVTKSHAAESTFVEQLYLRLNAREEKFNTQGEVKS